MESYMVCHSAFLFFSPYERGNLVATKSVTPLLKSSMHHIVPYSLALYAAFGTILFQTYDHQHRQDRVKYNKMD